MDGHQIMVMSFNVRGTVLDAGTANAWENRAAQNVETIRRHAPHIIGLQEAQRGNLETYREELPDYRLLRGPRYGNRRPHSFNAILLDPARLELLDSGGFWLSETPGEHSASWETRVIRSANWARLALCDADLSFLLLNTHLDHKSAPARRKGSALIVREVDRLLRRYGSETPVIVAGDFNCRPGTPIYKNFADGGFSDTFLAAGNRDAEGVNTFHAFAGTGYRDPHPERGPRRIDWILLKDPARRLRILSHEILRDHDDRSGLYPSDHYPILAELSPSS